MPGGAVLSRRRGQRHAIGSFRLGRPPQPLDGPAEAESHPLEVRERQAADRARHIAQGIAPRVPVFGGRRGGADAQSVEHDERGAPCGHETATRGSRGPRPVRITYWLSAAHSACRCSVIGSPPSDPSSVATSPSCTGASPTSIIVRSIVMTPTYGYRTP